MPFECEMRDFGTEIDADCTTASLVDGSLRRLTERAAPGIWTSVEAADRPLGRVIPVIRIRRHKVAAGDQEYRAWRWLMSTHGAEPRGKPNARGRRGRPIEPARHVWKIGRRTAKHERSAGTVRRPEALAAEDAARTILFPGRGAAASADQPRARANVLFPAGHRPEGGEQRPSRQ